VEEMERMLSSSLSILEEMANQNGSHSNYSMRCLKKGGCHSNFGAGVIGSVIGEIMGGLRC
jgi:hypothetical protein